MNAQVQDSASILFPPARIVQGDLYNPNTEDMQGNKLVVKSGANMGKERLEFFFAIAIPKNPGETSWTQTPWGAKLYQLAVGFWPGGQATTPRFSWKVQDGDDATPNPEANMRKNCDREGFPGCWVVRVSSGFKTRIYDDAGSPLLTDGLVKRGYWVEVLARIASNENAQKPGIYINHDMVAYRAPGPVISSGPDPRSVGFGRSALPAGVTPQPLGNTANMPAAPAAPSVPGAVAPPVSPAPVQTPVQPAPGFMVPPPPAAAPAVPTAPAVPAAPPPAVVCPLGAPMGYKMTNLNGGRYEVFKNGGWTDPLLVQHGHMVKL